MTANSFENLMRSFLMGWRHVVKTVTAAATVAFYELYIEVDTPASSNYNITLPPMDDAIGLTYHFKAITADGGTATVVPGADAPALSATPALKAAGDFVTVTPVGEPSARRWVILDSKITS
jgi:hypothetical protein